MMRPIAASDMTRPALGYRADVDGLRAIAVLAVVLFHSGVTSLSGGFAGVDVFFVISGYLLGGIVHREIEDGRFTFTAFYLRRARRILPALIAVAFGTLALGLILLGPRELQRFAISSATALLGTSNVWFLHTADYFAPDARLEPFLMTWSLGIEEQFYVALPILLLLIRRLKPSGALWAALGLSAISLLLSAVATPHLPTESFYLLPTRAWELGAGVALAMAHEACRAVPRHWHDPLSALGLAMIGASLFLYDEQVRFPGLAALVPVLGTLALIASPQAAINRRLLASRPFVGLGLISYSWYLWHWPLLALLRICSAGLPPQGWLLAIGLGSILPAYASWRWIEQPFRHPSRRHAPNTALARYGAALAGVVVLMASVAALHGLPSRVGAQGAAVEEMLAASEGNACLSGYGVSTPNLSPACAPAGTRPLIALLGDSHASALGDALRDQAKARGYDVLQLTAASCPPLLGATRKLPGHPGAAQACAAFNRNAIARAAGDPRVALVILTGFWQGPLSPRALASGEGYTDGSPASSAAVFRASLTRTLTRFARAGKPVLLLGDTPWLGFDPALDAQTGALPARAALQHALLPDLDTSTFQVTRDHVSPLDDEGARIVAETAARAHVPAIALRDILCSQSRCHVSDGALPLYVDPQHLSRAGADWALTRIGDRLWPLVKPSATPR